MSEKPHQNSENADGPLVPDALHGDDAHAPFFRRWLDRFSLAWLFLTRVPLPKWWNKPLPGEDAETDSADKGRGMTPLADTVRTWPVVGLFVGALAGLAVWLGGQMGLHPLASGFLGLIAAVLVTGALHEDGLADVADGFGGGADTAKKLSIMKDSHIGTYGVLALVLGVGFKAGSLAGFNGPALAAGALMAAHVLSRAMLPMMMVVMTPARSGGLGKAAGTPQADEAVVAVILGVLLGFLILGLGPGLVAAVLAALGAAGVAWLAQRQIGGYTGDVLGAAQQVAEALVLVGMAVAFRTVFYL